MILEKQFSSISELRDQTSKVVKEVSKFWKKIILSNNKPIWVFLSVEEYNNLKKLSFDKEESTKEDIKVYAQSSHWKDWVEAFSFLDTLK